MFFEGSEKKATITVNSDKLSLLTDIDNDFWHKLVAQSEAHILSTIENDQCKAFLLSESSLFVWQDRLLILTCGTTRLVNAIEFFIKTFGIAVIEQLVYQRKNEYYAQAQLSCFGDDIKQLSHYMPAKAYRFGELDSHHNYVFHQDNHFQANTKDVTYELLAYQISTQASAALTAPNLSKSSIRTFLRLDKWLPDYQIDDFVFNPYGYSLNAIKGEHYLTIHVTPQPNSSYISFESNTNLLHIASELLAILSPKSFDLITFNEQNFSQLAAEHIPSNYVSKSLVSETLSNGYLVCFANFVEPQSHFSAPNIIDISGDEHTL